MGLLTDGLVILAYFAVIIAVGLTMGRREERLRDFALGNRQVPWWAVMASIIAADISAATFLGAPGEGYDKCIAIAKDWTETRCPLTIRITWRAIR